MNPSLKPLAAALCFASFAHATDVELEPVTVTASRLEEPAAKALASVTVISRDTLDRYPTQDLSEILRFEAGLTVARLGGLGGQTSIFTRGTDSNHTLVLIDGVRINPATSSIPNIQNIALSDVERIEVVKGALSSLYGSDAIGGVINIITKNPEKNATRINLTSGSNKLAKGSITQTLASDNFSALLDANGLYTDGYDIIENLSVPRGQNTRGAGVKLNAKAGSTTVSLQGRQNQGTTEYYDGFSAPPTLSQDFSNDLLNITAKSAITDSFSTQLRVSQMQDEIDQNQSVAFAHTREREIDWQNTWQANTNLSYVLGASLTRTQSDYDNGFFTTFDKDEKKKGVYLQQKWQAGKVDTQISGRHDKYDSIGSINTGNLALGYAFDDNNRVYTNFGTGFHAPDFNDLYGFGGNPLLKSEESVTREIGSRHQVGNTTWKFAFFRNDIDNLITTSCLSAPPWTCTNINVDKATIRGTEASFRWANNGWFVGFSGDYIRPRDASTGAELLRRPRRTLTADTGYNSGNWGTSILVQSKSRAMDAGSRRVPGYTVVNAQAWWQAAESLRLQFNVDNIGDKTYGAAYQSANQLYVGSPLTASISATLSF